VSNQLVELALNRPPDARRAHVLLSLADQLLFLIGQHVPESSARKATAIRQRIDAWRAALHQETDPFELAALARQVVLDCETMLNRLHGEAADREAEFVDLVSTLRGVVEAIRGHARQFDAEMQHSAGELDRLADIQDIRELKRALAREVIVLRTTIVERQKAEARTTERLAAQVKTLEDNLQKARAEAATDALTGVPNRGGFDMAVREWIARAVSEHWAFTLGMIDLDDFKRINDTHGHQVGDRVLIAATQLLTDAAEQGEVVSRYGGEEFAFLMYAPTAAQAKARLTTVMQHIAPAYEYEIGGEKRHVTFTFSAGVTEYASGDTPDSLVKRADEALYDAKRRGKKRVECRTRSFLRALVG
jgi:diguanylate cyclase